MELLGLFVLYATIHFFVLQHTAKYSDRTRWEKIVTWVAIGSISLIYLGLMIDGYTYY